MSAVASGFFFAPVRAMAPALGAAAAAKSKAPAASPVASLFQQVDTARDAADADCHAHHTYWPCEFLNDFVLRMAAQGHCVNMSMMLGHRPYALERLALALQAPDVRLQGLARQLRPYFDAPVLEAGRYPAGTESVRVLERL